MGGREQDGQTSLRNVFNGSKFLVSKEERLMEPSWDLPALSSDGETGLKIGRWEKSLKFRAWGNADALKRRLFPSRALREVTAQ